jgi:periplasmic protein TonB
LGILTLFLVLGFGGPVVATKFFGEELKESIIVVGEEMVLEKIDPFKKEEPILIPEPSSPAISKTLEYTPPKIVPDKEVMGEELPDAEILKDVTVGKFTTEGTEGNFIDDEGPIGGNEIIVETETQPELYVEEMPEFPGGEKALMDYIGNAIHYLADAIENDVTGTVYIDFVVEKDGHVSSVVVRRGIGSGCDEEAARVIKSLPKYKPGRQNGRAVRVMFTVPIKFNLR